MLFTRVIEASRQIASTRARTAKIDTFAELIRSAQGPEIEPVVAWLAGELRQGRLGVGWKTLVASRPEPAPEAALTVADVEAALTELAGISGTGSTARRAAALSELLGAATAEEQDLLVRMLTGELRQGSLEGLAADAIARAADLPAPTIRRAAMLSGDLPAVARIAITDGAAAVAQIGLTVGRPVRPMLASPGESLSAALAALGPQVSVEYKLDGARIQVHRDGREVLVVTRTLRDITASVPELVELVLALPCRSIILDGETLALNDSGRPRPFQETMSRFGSASGELLLTPFFFDCLHLDGMDLLDEPLSRRLQALESVVGDHRIPALMCPDTVAAQAHFDAAIADGHEGVMVKALDSTYAAGRRGKSWLKIKPEHTLDLVVIAAEWGYGRRTGWLSNLHLGARDPDGGAPIMVGKTFKGLTDELLRWQTEEFVRHESHRDAHTVYLRPEIVVEIELDGVQTSTRYPGGVALRFARVVRYRPDKTAAQADTIDAVRSLR
ncbi:ATP-dependent DNA ligase [Williamsia sp. CHRR-6]|uniref:ATP-dependent DNA ligase n=1 Tax=Williamsia sp. CHRR-6 TaxID=2835871 RepID=UPI001BD9AE3C|nr:ATP-dependent DNA ligase [Williamsia sp. CHRR-6]MBT0567706.1 ATP-dependent DNA ligase [Williamsia sp. CHRR-6]